MGKQKSSATSATRKKHAKKAAANAKQDAPEGSSSQAQQRGGKAAGKGKGKGKKNEPRVKMYIPPVKPQALQRDPIDVLGLASALPPDLVIVFRKLTKKDAVTRRRALEELQSDWFDKYLNESNQVSQEEKDGILQALQTVLPAWNQHFPALTLNSSRRVRFLTATIQANILQIPDLREQLESEVLDSDDIAWLQSYYGTWMLSSCDVDRQVAQIAEGTWKLAIEPFHSDNVYSTTDDMELHHLMGPLQAFILHAVMHPDEVYNGFYPTVTQPVNTINKSEGTLSGERVITEAEEESLSDRNGRIRVGALAGLLFLSEFDPWLFDPDNKVSESSKDRPLDLVFNSPEFWSILFPGKRPPYVSSVEGKGDEWQGFGTNQPLVRRLGWTLVHRLATTHLGKLEGTTIRLMSVAVLRSIWIDSDSGVRLSAAKGLLTFLRSVPSAWTLAESYLLEHSPKDDMDTTEDHSGNKAYSEFLEFLRLACGGTAIQFYPGIVLIISNLPQELFPVTEYALTELFDAFWAAVDSHALTVLEKGSQPYTAFLTSVLETAHLVCSRLMASEYLSAFQSASKAKTRDPRELARSVMVKQIDRTWEYYSTDKLRINGEEFGPILAQSMDRLESLDKSASELVWMSLSGKITNSFKDESIDAKLNYSTLWRSLDKKISHPLGRKNLYSMLHEILQISLDRLFEAKGATLRLLAANIEIMLEDISEVVRENNSTVTELESLFNGKMAELAGHLSPDDFSKLNTAYLFFLRMDNLKRQNQWHSILTFIGESEASSIDAVSVLQSFTKMAQSGRLKGLKPRGEELNIVLGKIVQVIDQEASFILLKELIREHAFFLSNHQLRFCSSSLCTILEEASNSALRDPDYIATNSINNACLLFSTLRETLPDLFRDTAATLAAPLFVLSSLYPHLSATVSPQPGVSKLLAQLLQDDKDSLLNSISPALRSWVTDLGVRASPKLLINAAMNITSQDSGRIFQHILPSQDTYERQCSEMASRSPNPLISVVDLLVSEEESDQIDSNQLEFDRDHLPLYARIVWSLIYLVTLDRQLLRDHPWILKHALLLQLLATDFLSAPGVSSTNLGSSVSITILDEIINSIQLMTTYFFSDIASTEVPHKALIEALNGSSSKVEGKSNQFILDICQASMDSGTIQMARVARLVLQHVLRGASASDIDSWLTFARQIKDKNLHTSECIVHSLILIGGETPMLSRFRNEIASDIIGIPPTQANAQGTQALRYLLILAPSPDTDIVFLPPQRAINLVQTIEKWVASDEDIDPEIESRTLALLCHLVPILQSLSGGHWDLTFDLIESTLENSSLQENDTIVQLKRSIELVSLIQEYASSNKQLKGTWKARRQPILQMIKGLLTSAEAIASTSDAQKYITLHAMEILQELPDDLVDADCFSKLVYLLQMPSLEAQTVAYPLIKTTALRHTEKNVIDVGLNTTGDIEAQLPSELIHLLKYDDLMQFDEDDNSESDPVLFGFLLSWMILFDAFENTSLRVRSNYVEQLRDARVIQESLIPALCNFLDLGKQGRKPFKLDLWEVDNFIISLYEPTAFRVLAAHVYYRALRSIPSLIRSWWTDCKDRQLSTAVASYTAAYFSPILISSELSNLRDSPDGTGPTAREKLEDEALTIKISNSISEVSVVYLVDEQQMEMAIRMPPEYPLKLGDVRDVRRVGVAEDKWRGWLLAVQQIIGTQNGHIADAIALFKKNVTLHFQGQVECAICYSIISVTDLQLPSKPCKTCKNRFHASCLYKWFKSSSSSSCPLCRSDIF